MQILICVKQVPDDSVEIRLDDKVKKPNLNGVSMVANAFDTYALEMAVRFVEANGGNVTVLNVGADDSVNTLKNCLSVGANEAYFVKDDSYADLDAIGTADVLADAINKIEKDKEQQFDLILCGMESTDEITGQVGAMLAEKMDKGFISRAIEVSVKDNGMEVHQETDEGYNVVSIGSPAVVTVSKPVIPTYSASEIGEVKQAKVQCIEYIEPPKREAGIKIQEKDAALAVSAVMEQMKKDKAI